ncbi:hypothetical protein G7Z17_g3847 [Cylindrodendrum hubeiense]|uniref:Uncharacterized protein n=1 Tax=Cylindrodendrum hubeiense TaxID=595255 RepID=A0A9P5HH49_9HYPO|nr:hypothetical protein G7Z17_g3847 [Cylindrodendrum hubeiense]
MSDTPPMSTNIADEELKPQESYLKHLDTLRDMIANDHFGGEMPTQIVDQWVKVLEPGGEIEVPAGVKGFYGGSLRSSIPIEVARGSYKFITHETVEKGKIDKYARRMLIALSLLDIDTLVNQDPNLGALALWHIALAQVRLPDRAEMLGKTLIQYQDVRPKSKLSDSKLPQPDRLKTRLTAMAKDIDNEPALNLLINWHPF